MKKLVYILLSAILLMATQSQAQVYSSTLAAGDTVVDAGTAAKVINITGDYKGVVFNPIFTKISGTVAGTIKLQGSLDGSTYTDVASQTFTATNIATGQTLWYVAAPLARYYKITWTGTGTMSAVLSYKYRVNK
jgi:adenylyl- and sulfurtransferase ThiI